MSLCRCNIGSESNRIIYIECERSSTERVAKETETKSPKAVTTVNKIIIFLSLSSPVSSSPEQKKKIRNKSSICNRSMLSISMESPWSDFWRSKRKKTKIKNFALKKKEIKDETHVEWRPHATDLIYYWIQKVENLHFVSIYVLYFCRVRVVVCVCVRLCVRFNLRDISL